MQFQIAPSLLAADFLNLGSEIRALEDASADMLHLDIMDGTFVPNISFGFSVVDAVAKISRLPLDAHLMIVHPEKYFEKLASDGVAMISFHLEAALADGSDPSELLRLIRSYGIKAGLAINPDIPVENCFPFLEDADFVLVMSVFAGFGGQKMVDSIFDRVKTLKAEILRRNVHCMVEIDGGVTKDNIAKVASSGVDIAVAGSAVFKTGNPGTELQSLREFARG